MKKTTYIALLRAINVGGRTVKMEKLRELFSELGLEDVRTYIQTGNVFFTSEAKDRAQLTAQIEEHLKKSLGYEVPVMLRTVDELEYALSLDPFKDVEITDEVRLCIAFLSEPLPEDVQFPLVSPKEDMRLLSVTKGEVFLVAYHAPGKAANAAAFIEKAFKVKTTTRFWGTTGKILEAAKK
ncbi:DUF1697 domain-containing protein [bacterium]|nr:MAG: DUF1697 domain-containing protein [bacterium]